MTMKKILFIVAIFLIIAACKKESSNDSSGSAAAYKGVWNRTSGNATTAIAIGCVKDKPENYIFMCEWDTPYPDSYDGTIDFSTGEIKWQSPPEYAQHCYKAEVSGTTLNLFANAYCNGSYVSAGTYVKGSWPGTHCDLEQSGDIVQPLGGIAGRWKQTKPGNWGNPSTTFHWVVDVNGSWTLKGYFDTNGVLTYNSSGTWVCSSDTINIREFPCQYNGNHEVNKTGTFIRHSAGSLYLYNVFIWSGQWYGE
jgi:hypothetical protein